MGLFNHVDLTSLVTRQEPRSDLSRSEFIQRICDEAATLARCSPYSTDLYFSVTDELAAQDFFRVRFPAATTNASGPGQPDATQTPVPEHPDFAVWREEIKQQLGAVAGSQSLLELANLYYDEGNYPVAVQYFHQAADYDNNLTAYLSLGYLYTSGVVKKDLDYAFKCFEYVARCGLPEAYFPLALAYMFGDGVTKDTGQAAAWLKKAHEAGDPDASVWVVECLVDGTLHFVKNVPLAHDLIFNQVLPVMQQRPWNYAMYPRALFCAGYVLDQGYGAPAQALAYYEQAAQLGFSRTYPRLYVLYIDGLGGRQDTQRAVHYLRLAAAQNDPTALYNLARSYLDGTIERLNREKAFAYLVEHALLQYADACRKQPGLERGLANYLLAQMLEQLGIDT